MLDGEEFFLELWESSGFYILDLRKYRGGKYTETSQVRTHRDTLPLKKMKVDAAQLTASWDLHEPFSAIMRLADHAFINTGL